MMIPDVVVVDDDDDRDDDAFRVRLQDDSVELFVRLVDAARRLPTTIDDGSYVVLCLRNQSQHHRRRTRCRA